jgi:hypothetical protein
MHKMWGGFSTLQRPSQEEKERRRKYSEDKKRNSSTLMMPSKGKVGRAKTFRMERNNNDIMLSNGPTSLPASASMVEVLRHRAKSATRHGDNIYGGGGGDFSTQKRRKSKDRDHSAHGAFVSRLRFLDPYSGSSDQPPKLRWQDREPSSGYSSGGRGGHYGEAGGELPSSDNDNIYGVKFASMPQMSSSSKG